MDELSLELVLKDDLNYVINHEKLIGRDCLIWDVGGRHIGGRHCPHMWEYSYTTFPNVARHLLYNTYHKDVIPYGIVVTTCAGVLWPTTVEHVIFNSKELAGMFRYNGADMLYRANLDVFRCAYIRNLIAIPRSVARDKHTYYHMRMRSIEKIDLSAILDPYFEIWALWEFCGERVNENIGREMISYL